MERLTCSTAPGRVFTSREELHVHYQSDLHRYNLRRKAAGLAPISEEIFRKMKIAMEQREAQVKTQLATKKLDHVKQSKRDSQQVGIQKQHRQQQAAAEAAAASASAGEDEAEADELEIDEEEMKKPVDLNKSFFDGHVAKSMDENLDYMRRRFGFILPDEERVKDKEGIVKYCAQKISVGRLCLFCERPFRSRDACVRHMLDRGHCKISWEYEDDLEEFSDFYMAESEMENDGKKKKQTMELTESGEYVFRDGNNVRRVGVRQFRVYYRQKLRPAKAEKASVIANAREELVRLYRNTGMDPEEVNTLALAREHGAMPNHPLTKKGMNERKARVMENQKYQLAAGIVGNLLMRNRIAGTNRGVGHGVHG